jgi:hypothetical protein
MSIDNGKLHELLGKAVVDFGATFHAALVVIGDKLGLYKALAAAESLTPAELAERPARRVLRGMALMPGGTRILHCGT